MSAHRLLSRFGARVSDRRADTATRRDADSEPDLRDIRTMRAVADDARLVEALIEAERERRHLDAIGVAA